MKVKVNGQEFDSHKEPIMIVMSEGERLQIGNMEKKSGKRIYAQYPVGHGDEVNDWMKKELGTLDEVHTVIVPDNME